MMTRGKNPRKCYSDPNGDIFRLSSLYVSVPHHLQRTSMDILILE